MDTAQVNESRTPGVTLIRELSVRKNTRRSLREPSPTAARLDADLVPATAFPCQFVGSRRRIEGGQRPYPRVEGKGLRREGEPTLC